MTREPHARMPNSALGALVALVVTLLLLPTSARAGGDWNDAGIAWRAYEEGLAEARRDNKPVCLVFYTAWCPHCTRYSAVFHDPKVVAASKKLVMIRLDKDANKALSAKYAPDGEYIPRTFFLAPDGTLQQDIHEQRAQYKYFYNESDPASVLRGMSRALEVPKAKR